MSKPNCLGEENCQEEEACIKSGLESFACAVVHDKMDWDGEQATGGCGERGERRKVSCVLGERSCGDGGGRKLD